MEKTGTDNSLAAGIFATFMMAAITWFGFSISAPWIWVPFGSFLTIAFIFGFAEAWEKASDNYQCKTGS